MISIERSITSVNTYTGQNFIDLQNIGYIYSLTHQELAYHTVGGKCPACHALFGSGRFWGQPQGLSSPSP